VAEPIQLGVINYPTDVVQSFGDAAKIDRQLGEPGASERAPTSSSSSSSSYPRSDYYVYKDKGEGGATYPIPQTKNLFGANIDVISTLDEVVFEKFGDGSMQNAIAYITPWKRGGVSSKSSPSVPSEALYREDFLGDLNNRLYSESFTSPDLNLNLGTSEFASNLDFNNSPAWDPENSEWYTTDVGLGFDTNFNIDTKGKTGGNAQDQEPRQRKLASQIPIGLRQGLLTGAQLTNSYFSKDNSQVGKYIETGLNLAGRATDTPSGPVYIGNPAGVINQGLNLATMFGFNIPGRGLTTSIPPNLQSSSPKVIGAQANAPEGMWQFLFNPNELALNVGPKYKATETWGVLDDANGGQPLHFTNLVNPKLKFSKVLLNGYVFGKRVENLEQGLIDLFMKNPSGNTSHGPQVLEFVWGQRCFGPCVIKDITINEKQWDNGLLVNATVSFTLEKVPEWSINDGQVSVYDASSLDSIISPVQTSSEDPEVPDTDPEPPATQPEETPKTDEPTTSTKTLTENEKDLYKKCQKAFSGGGHGENFYKIETSIRRSGGGFFSKGTSKNALRSALQKYTTLHNLVKSEWGREFTKYLVDPLANPTTLKRRVDIAIAAETQVGGGSRAFKELNSAANWIASAAEEARKAVKAISDSDRCTALRTKEGNAEKSRAKARDCKSKAGGSPCSVPGSIGQTCGGTKTICGRNGFWQNESTYK